MRVTRLEIFGFKSFVDRFVLNFDKNMIGIVGPNGCGKSNVVDALRWVLGESHAKQLRGGSFDDLIFNGSETRRQLGMAEVSLTIRPEPNWKSNIELEDPGINEFRNIEADLENAIVETSELDNLNTANDDQPVLKSRIDLVGQRASEIPGLFEASEIQFTRRLYRSGESEYYINKVACRLRDMQDLYRLIGLGARGLSIVQQGHIGQFISKKPIERRELLEEAAGISGFRNKMEAATRRLVKTEDNLSRVSDILLEVDKQVKVLKRQAARARDRQSLKEELQKSELELYQLKGFKLKSRITNADAEIDSLTLRLNEHRANSTDKNANLIDVEARLHEVEVESVALRREKDELARVIMAEESRLQEIRVRLASLDSTDVHLKSREEQDQLNINSLDTQELSIKENLDKLSSELKYEDDLLLQARNELIEIEKENLEKINSFQAESNNNPQDNSIITEIGKKIVTLSSQIEDLEFKLQEIGSLEQSLSLMTQSHKQKELQVLANERSLNLVKSEIRAIEKQLESLVLHTLETTQSISIQGISLNESTKVLLSLITIPQNLEKAVHAVLGEKANYLVTENSLQMLELFKEGSNKVSQVGVIDLNIPLRRDLVGHLSSGVQELISLVSYEEKYEKVIKSLLKCVWVADTLSDAIRFKSELLAQGLEAFSIVLKSGEVLTPWGWYSTEGEGLHFSFTRKKLELVSDEKVLFETGESLKQELIQIENELKLIKDQVSETNQIRGTLANCQREVSNLLKSQSDEERKHFHVLREREHQLRGQLREVEKAKGLEIVALEQKIYSIKSDIKLCNSQLSKLNEERENLKAALITYAERFRIIAAERQELGRTNEDVNFSLNSTESYNRKNRVSELEQLIENQENLRSKMLEDLSQVRLESSNLRKELDTLDNQIRDFTADKDRADIEFDMLSQDFLRYYPDMSFDSILESTDENLFDIKDPNELSQRVDSLSETANTIRRRLEREGEVDPQSIEQYEIESARLISMTNQHKDLLAAKETLEKTIKQLKEYSKIRFVNTFAAVNEKFKELVPRLFSGGSGYLELINPEDPLQSGVEIVVRPPGKKITTMELMSGGEKALVATAVLVSVFLHHPGPICVLDEIDAPLDDANLLRLLDLIKEIAHKTQFLVITHNKITMQAVDRLIGITMQESGVTTALSVTLDQAEEELERLVANA